MHPCKKKIKKFNQIREQKAALEKRMEELQAAGRRKDSEYNMLKLASEVEKEMVFGDGVELLNKCEGCPNCRGERECYVVQVSKAYEINKLN